MKRRSKDKQVSEFEKKDIGRDVRRNKSALRVAPKNRPTSILLPKPLIEKLKEKAGKRGIGYQTMLKIIIAEQMDRY